MTKTLKKTPLHELVNIGPTIARRLNEIGIFTHADLERLGAVGAYRRLRARHPNSSLPVCYYLYSLEGAILGCRWDQVPPDRCDELSREVRGR